MGGFLLLHWCGFVESDALLFAAMRCRSTHSKMKLFCVAGLVTRRVGVNVRCFSSQVPEFISSKVYKFFCTDDFDCCLQVYDGIDAEQKGFMLEDKCILVDENDNMVGSGNKEYCHLLTNVRKGNALHRYI